MIPDCGDNSCRYATQRGGMRTNGGCRCDDCPECGRAIRPTSTIGHRPWCTMKDWLPEHHRSLPYTDEPWPEGHELLPRMPKP